MSDQPGKTFSKQFCRQFAELIAWRRDVRRFTGKPVDEALVRQCLQLANMSPSVGLSQPWRFVELVDPARRQIIIDSFEKCNAEALADYDGADKTSYARLKLEGLREAPVQMAVFADTRTTKGKGVGRKTMPEMTAYSVVTAIHTFWLAARTCGLGVGWVSILEPEQVANACDAPDHWQLIACLCIGWPQHEMLTPELETAGWESRSDISEFYTKL